jgi:hypothetical protein
MSTGAKIAIAGGVVVAGVVLYEVLKPKPSTPPVVISAAPSNSSGSNPVGNVLSIVNSLKGLFGSSSSAGSGSSVPAPGDPSWAYIAGTRRNLTRR